MWKFVISFLVLVISLPYSAFGITVSGTVLDGDDDNNAPLSSATVCVIDQQTEECSTNGTITDLSGKFTISNVDETSNIQISFIGYETRTLSAKENMGTIILKTDNSLDEVTIVYANCKESKYLEPLHATAASNIKDEPTKCYPTRCKPTYKLVGFEQNATCKSRNGDPCDKTDLGIMYGTAGTYTCNTDKCICNITKCNTKLYQQTPNKQGECVSLSGTKCTITNAKNSEYVCTPTSCICNVIECNKNFIRTEDQTRCVSKHNAPCDTNDLPAHAKSGQYDCDDNGCTCNTNIQCDNNYVPNANGTGCVSTECPNCQIWNDETKKCDDNSDINQDCTPTTTGAKKATYVCENNEKICKIDECNSAYEKKGNQCESLSGTTCSNPPLHATGTYRTFDDSGNEICHVVKCKNGYKPSEDESSCVPAKEYDKGALEQNADQAHENENSLANRMLGGASMAAMGIGGMELAQGLAQQRADAKADADMTAYLATFKCEYGPNHAQGGTTGNEIPGANQLFNLYQEYAALASSVKATKEALNMTPGIESQVILDKANIGLYDDVSTGKTNGTYASLYRAKMGSDVDQAKLQEMSDTSKNRVIGGAVTASTGAAAGIGGDVLLNQIDWNKNNSDAKNAE
ncbi:MAG: carboxypeptidase-like regulatory domain-containing protein [Alphaproteobacteria bacterium]